MKKTIIVIVLLLVAGCQNYEARSSHVNLRFQQALTAHSNIVENLNDQQKRAYLVWLQSITQEDFVTQHDRSVEAKAIIPQWDIIENTFNEMQFCNQQKFQIENERKANAAAWGRFCQGLSETGETARKNRESKTIHDQPTVIYQHRGTNNSTYWQEKNAEQQYRNN